MSIPSLRVAAPRPPEAPTPFKFPLLASTAPVVVAVAIWAITGSLFALIFAALGPVTALASFVDSKVGGRRARRREQARFAKELATAAEHVRDAHAHEASTISETAPDAEMITDRRGADPYRWRHEVDRPVALSLGSGERQSSIDLQGLPASPHPDGAVTAALAQLETTASHLNAPILADARLGIAVCGPAVLTAAWSRAVAVQLAWALPPDRCWYRRLGGAEFAWMDALLHPREPGVPRAGAIVEFGIIGDNEPLTQLAMAADPEQLFGGCRVIVSVDEGGRPRVLEHPERSARQSVDVVTLSREQAVDWAERIRADAVRDGRVTASSELPDRVDLVTIIDRTSARTGLSAPVAVDAQGIVELDLVSHGPHAVVGGTTGSGKSELLIGWVLSMAAVHSPEKVNFLLVDFKGGAAFAALERLPHTVGTITDLDDDTARRALDSLRAELRYRERELALAGARSVDDHQGMSRLVIVVDEFQAMLAEHPDLHTLFADIAARGRSLGVHLILCTQRPGAVVRDGVLANADLRISLRVNNRSDSTAVVGVDDAARISASARGRAVVRVGGEQADLVQFALADASVTEKIIEVWPEIPAPRRPWREPLPPKILGREIPPSPEGVIIGMLDLPHEQRWDTAVWNETSGHLLVMGGPRSGKSAALATVAQGVSDPLVLSPEPDQAWQLIADLTERPHACTLIIDDLDTLLSRFSSDYRIEFVERLSLLLREGPAWGMSCVTSVSRMSSEISASAGRFPHRLTLGYPSRSDHVLAGGEGADFREGLPPGAGTWKGARIQVALADRPLISARIDPAPVLSIGALAIVTSRVPLLMSALASDPTTQVIPLERDVAAAISSAQGRAVVVADVDQWQANWGALTAARSVATVVLHACSPADFRALTRSRELPPPLPPGDSEACWVLAEDGTARRARLPLRPRTSDSAQKPQI